MAEAPVVLAKESMGGEIVQGLVKNLQPEIVVFCGEQAVSYGDSGRDNPLSGLFSIIFRGEIGQKSCGNPFIEKRELSIH